MSKSLDFLINTTNGKKDPFVSPQIVLSDDDVLKEAKKINDLQKRTDFLIKFLNTTPDTYWKSTEYLIELILDKNSKMAFDLSYKLFIRFNLSPLPHWYIAQIALNQKAYSMAKEASEIAIWLSCNEYKDCLNKSKDIQKKILKTNIKDNSDKMNKSHEIKIISISLVLSKISISCTNEITYNYSKRLLELYPKENENYLKVIEILSDLEDKTFLERIIAHIKATNHLTKEQKNLLIGIAYYHLNDPIKSKSHLEEVGNINQDQFIAKFYTSLNDLIQGNENEFINLFNQLIAYDSSTKEDIKKILEQSTPLFLATIIIWSSLSDKKIPLEDIHNDAYISREIDTKILSKIFLQKNHLYATKIISRLSSNGFETLLPSLIPILAETYIKNGLLDNAKEILKQSDHIECHRIFSWIHRIEGNITLAEEELINYRSKLVISENSSLSYQMVNLNYPEKVDKSETKILEILNGLYDQVKSKKNELATEYGINQNTCFETNCNECCKKTYPQISYTEYLFIRKWLDKQPKDYQEKIHKESNRIVALYKEKYKKDPPFLSTKYANETSKSYPKDFQFDCPALTKEGCSIYEVQPFICRTYGYGSNNRTQYQGCGYFKDQFSFASGLSRTRKLIDILSFINFMGITDEKLIETSVLAPIPVWFAQKHEETVWKAKLHLLSRGITKPLYFILSKLYFYLLNRKLSK